MNTVQHLRSRIHQLVDQLEDEDMLARIELELTESDPPLLPQHTQTVRQRLRPDTSWVSWADVRTQVQAALREL
jgi:hypothetical protein